MHFPITVSINDLLKDTSPRPSEATLPVSWPAQGCVCKGAASWLESLAQLRCVHRTGCLDVWCTSEPVFPLLSPKSSVHCPNNPPDRHSYLQNESQGAGPGGCPPWTPASWEPSHSSPHGEEQPRPQPCAPPCYTGARLKGSYHPLTSSCSKPWFCITQNIYHF